MPGYSGDLKMEKFGGKKQTKKPKIHNGPRGGKYIIKNGKKNYLKS